MSKHCLDCGTPIVGRSDKKFCSDYCRNNYHNRQNKNTNNYVRKINYVLKRNRRILESFYPGETRKVHRSYLKLEGFDFNYFTSVFQNHNGHIYYFCYDLGYVPLDNDYIALVGMNGSGIRVNR